MRARGRLTLPRVTTLPNAAPADQLVSLAGVPWFSDGTSWGRLGAPTPATVTIDAGPIPTPEVSATVAVAGLAAGASVLAWLAPTAPGKDADEVPMDVVDVWAYGSAAGQLTVRLTGLTGYLADQFTVTYLVL